MRITLLAVGSRGDVQPVIALGCHLQGRGHGVTLATHGEFAGMASAAGLQVSVLGGLSLPDLMHEMTANAARRRGGRLFADFLPGIQRIRAGLPGLLDDCLAAITHAEAVGFSPQLLPLAGSLAETGRSGLFCTCLQPVVPTGEFPSPFLGLPSFGSHLNRVGYTLPARLFRPLLGKALDAWRKRSLALGPADSARVARWLGVPFPVLCGFSGLVVPRPRDWGSSRVVCGYWRLPAGIRETPDAALVRFVEGGDPPVAVGFGSMADRQAEDALAGLLEALEACGLRAVIQTPLDRAGGRPLPGTVFRADALDHDWLFPRTKAVVHHCGAGTAATVMHAGVPSVPVPFAFEQPWWARRLHRLGVATAVVPRYRLDPARLASALKQAVSDGALRERCRTLADQLGREDGLAAAGETLERLLHT